MVATQELVEALVERFPEDADDLRDALEVLQKQRLSSCDRLAKLNDSQWQRLGVPIGIETILRDAVDSLQKGETFLDNGTRAAPAHSEQVPQETAAPLPAQVAPKPLRREDSGELPLDPFEPEPQGLRRRGGGGGNQQQQQQASDGRSGGSRGSSQKADGSERRGLLSPMDLTPPDDLDLLWQQLLEDTLPPDKRAALMDSWERAGDAHDKYMMFLEYSSYLRKPEITEEEKEERRKQLEPLMKEFGINPSADDSGWQGGFVWCIFVAVIIFIAALIYYTYATIEPAHDSQAL